MPAERISWKDSNLALIGSDLDHKIKQAAASGETAWDGMGETPETRVWRIEQFHVVPWPKDRYGQFHKGDTYIVLNTYKKSDDSDALLHDVHIWIGTDSSQDEYGTAAYKMVEADDYLGGAPVQHRQVQGHESAQFYSYFDGGTIEYLDGGVASGFRHVEKEEDVPVLFQVKGTRKNMSLTQVPLARSSLNAGDSFILQKSKAKVWVWHGAKAKPMEKIMCNQWAEKMCTLGTVVVMDQDQGDDEHTDFWDIVGTDGDIGPDGEDDEGVSEFQPLLYRVDGDPSKELELVATGSTVQKTSAECQCLARSDLNDNDVFLVDSGWEIYVWIGSGADRYEKIAAMTAADRYCKNSSDPGRTLMLPVHIVKSGHENSNFLALFA